MEENKETKQDPDQIQTNIKRMLTVEKKTSEEVVVVLMKDGMDKESAIKLVNYAIGANTDAGEEADDSSSGVKDMIVGGLFCAGGVIGTVADTGYIFWGAIVFGGIQFMKGS